MCHEDSIAVNSLFSSTLLSIKSKGHLLKTQILFDSGGSMIQLVFIALPEHQDNLACRFDAIFSQKTTKAH